MLQFAPSIANARMLRALCLSADLFADVAVPFTTREIVEMLEATGTDMPQHYAPTRAEMLEVLRANIKSQLDGDRS